MSWSSRSDPMTSPPPTATETPHDRAPHARRFPLRSLLPPVVILLLLSLIHWPRHALFQHAGQTWHSTALSLLAATFALAGLFQLAARTANERVAWGSVAATALYPVFYAASATPDARADLMATAVVMWSLFFSLLVRRGLWQRLLLFVLALLPALVRLVSAWQMGSNVGDSSTVGAMFGVRAWQAFGYAGLYLLTATMLLLTIFVKPVSDAGVERGRIDVRVQLGFVFVALGYIVILSFISDTGRASEMLPVVPLVILVSVSTVWRRVRYWFAVVAAVCAAFAFL